MDIWQICLGTKTHLLSYPPLPKTLGVSISKHLMTLYFHQDSLKIVKQIIFYLAAHCLAILQNLPLLVFPSFGLSSITIFFSS